MDLEDSTYILRQILSSELPAKSGRNRLWVMKLTQATDADARLSLEVAKEIVRLLSGRTIVLLVPRGNAVALFSDTQLHKCGVERLHVPGHYYYYAASNIPDRILFREKKPVKRYPTTNAMIVVDLRTTWLELLPFEVRHINGKLILRGASWLEHIRLRTEEDIMHIGHLEEWKKTSKKDRRGLEYCSITGFDRILAVNLLRKNFMRLTPGAKYAFHASDIHVRENAPARLHHLIISVSTTNRYRLFPLR
ncbi:MAG TPA: hypothetical protein VFB98_00220 [Candidatus Deferrimicrobium sp.]|nr:hypothetical protein [Candidatus Deferrimicrobium sp.]